MLAGMHKHPKAANTSMQMLVAIILGLLIPLTVAEPSSLGCSKGHGRSLLQSEGPVPYNASGLGSEVTNNGTIVQTLEVDLLQEMCIVTFNSFYPVGDGSLDQEVVPPGDNLQATAENCCASCAERADCNAWQWCPQEQGCVVSRTNQTYPSLGCQLLRIAAFSRYMEGFSSTRLRGPDIPFIAGAPFNMTLPQVPGYVLSPGADFGGMYDFPCAASSVAESCMVVGPAQESASICASDPRCQAFVFFPEGVAFDGSGPVGVLKSSGDANKPLGPSDLSFNPTGATYLKQSEADANNSNENGGNNVTIIAAVVASVVGVAALALVLGLLIFLRKKYRKMASAAEPSSLDKDGNALEAGSRSAVASGSSSVSSDGDGTVSTFSGDSKSLRRLDSPPSVVDINSGRRWSGRIDPLSLGYSLSNPPGTGTFQQLDQVVVVSEVPADSSGGSSALRAMPPGSTARELLEAFSQMYAHRPPVDYVKLAELLEDEEAVAAAAREEALEATYRASEAGSAEPSGSSSYPGGTAGRLEIINHAAATASGAYVLDGRGSSEPNYSYEPSVASDDGSDGWSIQPEDVEVCRRPDGSWWQLGTGAFGTVYKGLYRSTHSVAIKVLHRLEEPRHTDAFAREVSLLKTLRDRHVVQFLGACINGPQGTAMLVTELMELGDLWRALPARDSNGERIFAWRRRGRRVMEDVARGLGYLHSKRVVHFDLKSANILLSRAGTAKLADIGMARVLQKSYLSMVSSGLGTFAWSAPEVLAGKRCGCKADIYSLGVVLWEVCTGEAPVRGVMRPLQAPQDCPAEVVELYQRCIAEDPDERPTAEEILELLAAMPGNT